MTDHICRFCGTGRVLQQTNSGPTGGGNPVYRCSQCEKASASIGPNAICYCNFEIVRGSEDPRLIYETQCVRNDVNEGYLDHLEQNGWRQMKKHYSVSVYWIRLQ